MMPRDEAPNEGADAVATGPAGDWRSMGGHALDGLTILDLDGMVRGAQDRAYRAGRADGHEEMRRVMARERSEWVKWVKQGRTAGHQGEHDAIEQAYGDVVHYLHHAAAYLMRAVRLEEGNEDRLTRVDIARAFAAFEQLLGDVIDAFRGDAPARRVTSDGVIGPRTDLNRVDRQTEEGDPESPPAWLSAWVRQWERDLAGVEAARADELADLATPSPEGPPKPAPERCPHADHVHRQCRLTHGHVDDHSFIGPSDRAVDPEWPHVRG
jgi:hypothetical protein